MALPFACVAVGLYGFSSAWTAILLYDAGMVLLLAWSGAGDMSRLVRSGWSAPAGLALSALCATGGVGVYLLWRWMAPEGPALETRLAAFGLSGWKLYAMLVWLALVHPVIEEIHWRGRLLVGNHAPDVRDVIFAAYHIIVLRLFVRPIWLAPAFIVLLVTAWAWRQTTIRTGGLAIAVVSHTVADISVAVAVAALVW